MLERFRWVNTKIALWLSWALFVGFVGGIAYAQRPGQLVTGCIATAAAVVAAEGNPAPLNCTLNGSLRILTGS